MPVLKATIDNIRAASKIVKNGGVIVYPTDTVYGLGCDPFNVRAVKRVFKVKGEREKPLPVLGSDIRYIQRIAKLQGRARKIAYKFWPGPITIIIPKKPALPNIVTCNLDSVGVRIPNHTVAIRLISLSGGLLIGTSANKTGEKSPKTAREAAKQLNEEIDVILDGGPAPLGLDSNVIDLTLRKPEMLREGPIKLEEIMKSAPSRNS
jgi:L-threonylcarbamoyladenylate synthase